MSFLQVLSDSWAEFTSGGKAVTATYNSNDDNSSNDKPPSPAPPPTVYENDYSDPNNPQLDTDPNTSGTQSAADKAVEDARAALETFNNTSNSDLGIKGSERTDKQFAKTEALDAALRAAGQDVSGLIGYGDRDTDAVANFDGPDYNSVAAEETFGDAFAENRAAGNETFEYNGNLFTTELASDAPASTNLLSSNEQALVDEYNAVSDDDESYTPSSATLAAVLKSQDKTSVIADPLSVEEQVANYGGVDLDARDAANTAANNASAATAFDNNDFSYNVLPTGSGGITNLDSGGGRDLGADLGFGGGAATVTADDLISGENIVTLPSSGGGGVTLSTDLAGGTATSFDKVLQDIQDNGGNVGAAVDTLVGAPKTGVMDFAVDGNGDRIPGMWQMKYDDGTVSEPGDVFTVDKLRQESLGETTPDPVDLSFGSELPGDNVVADLSGYGNLTFQPPTTGATELNTPAVISALSEVAAAPPAATTETGPFVDAFNNEYATAEQAAQADVDANNAAVMANNPDFVSQFPGDVPEGLISSSADIPSATPDPRLLDTMFFDKGDSLGMDALRKLQSGFYEAGAGKVEGGAYAGDRSLNEMSSAANTVGQIFSQQTGQGRFLGPGSESDLGALIGKYAGQPVSTGTELQDAFAPTVGRLEKKAGAYNEQISPAMRERVRNAAANPAPGMEGKDMLGRPFGTDAAATALIGVGELGDTAVDVGAIAAGSALNVASRGLTLPLSIAAVGASSGAEAGGAAKDDALSQFDAALASGQIDGIEGKSDFEVAKIREELGNTAFNNAGLVATVADPLISGTLVAGKGITSLFKVPQFNNVLANAGLKYTGQLATATGGEFLTGAGEQVLGVNKPLLDAGVQGMNMSDGAYAAGLNEMLGGGVSSAVITPVQAAAIAASDKLRGSTAPGTLDPNLSPTSGQLADSTVQSAYEQAADSLGEAGLSNVGDTTASSVEETNEILKRIGASPLMDSTIEKQAEAERIKTNEILKRIGASPLAAGIAPNVDTTSVGEALVTKTPLSGVETALAPGTGSLDAAAAVTKKTDADNAAAAAVTKKIDADNAAPAVKKEDVAAVVEVAKSPDDIIAEQQQKSLIADLAISGNLTNESAEQLASQLGVDVITALDLVEEAAESMTSGEIDAAAAAAASKAGSEAHANFKPTTTLGKTTGILSAEDKAAREAAFNKAYEAALAASRKELFVGTGSDNADKAATEIKLPVAEDLASVVTEKADGGADVELSDGSTSKTVIEKDGKTTVTEKADGGATVDLALTPEQVAAADVKAVEDLYAKADAEIDNATDVKAIEDLYAKADAEIDALMTPETTTNADQTTDITLDATVVPLTDVEEDDVEEDDVIVELDEEEVTEDPVVTADPDVPDIFVPTITTTDEDGNTITECPEGYMMMETEDGPMCQKIVTARSSIQRAGAGTRAYTGLSGNRGRKGPGQKRKTTTSSTYERVAPTTTNA